MYPEESYPTDLTDSQWALLNRLLPAPKKRQGGPGRPPVDLRPVVNGILYLNKTGCQWRLLPRSFGHWKTIYGYFSRWRKTDVWASVMTTLRRKERERCGHRPEPSAGSIDSQSVKTVMRGDSRGYDGGKKTKGRKRHIFVDTMGLIIALVVTAADIGDRAGLKQLLEPYFSGGVQRLRKLWVDGGYSGQPLQDWVRGLKKSHKIDLEVTKRTEPGFQVIRKRWVVERTFGWLNHYRRLSKDYEILTSSSEAMIQISMIHLLLRRLA